MKNAQEKVASWKSENGQDVADKPCIPSFATRKLQAGLIFEESLESVVALGFRPVINGDKWEMEEYGTPDLIAIADGCSDLHVVTLGTEVACGLNAEANFNEVMRSNQSKMWSMDELIATDENWDDNHIAIDTNPECEDATAKVYVVKRKSDGKIIKSPSYSPANLQPIIEGEK